MTAEDRFVEQVRALLTHTEGVTLGPGDDAAVVSWEGRDLVATTDLLVEEVDFLEGEEPETIGRRCAAVNLSDLAAMGAKPRFFLLSIAFPPQRGDVYALAIVRGTLARMEPLGAALVGGDLSKAPMAVVSVALWGQPEGDPIRRSGALPGDLVYVSGFPGRAAAGLLLARRLAAFGSQGSKPTPRFVGLTLAEEGELLGAYRDPEPRVALGLALARERLAHAAIDVSDGLGMDAGRLARASGVRLVLEKALLPVSSALSSFAEVEVTDPHELLLSGGDDYELLVCAPESAADSLENPPEEWGVAVTRIGHVEEGSGAVLRSRRGDRDIAELGHDHLRNRS
jgi:thiamine-monophosphate kinase